MRTTITTAADFGPTIDEENTATVGWSDIDRSIGFGSDGLPNVEPCSGVRIEAPDGTWIGEVIRLLAEAGLGG